MDAGKVAEGVPGVVITESETHIFKRQLNLPAGHRPDAATTIMLYSAAIVAHTQTQHAALTV